MYRFGFLKSGRPNATRNRLTIFRTFKFIPNNVKN